MGAKRRGLSSKINWLAFAAYLVILGAALLVARRYANPAPPSRIIISTGADEGDYQTYAALYRSIIKKSGVELVIRPSSGTVQNLRLLKDPKSDVDVAFVQDGLDDSDEESSLVALGSLYYEPLWVFYPGRPGTPPLTRLSQLRGRRLCVFHHADTLSERGFRKFLRHGKEELAEQERCRRRCHPLGVLGFVDRSPDRGSYCLHQWLDCLPSRHG